GDGRSIPPRQGHSTRSLEHASGRHTGEEIHGSGDWNGTYLETAGEPGSVTRSSTVRRAHELGTVGHGYATNGSHAAPRQQAGAGNPITQTAERRDAGRNRERDWLAAAHGPRL